MAQQLTLNYAKGDDYLTQEALGNLELNRIYQMDCVDGMRLLPDESVDLIVSSPPYAEQRKKQYGGIPEKDYPEWTVKWMEEVKRILKPDGSVAINIRPHIRNGQISDYTLKTRLALREAGWVECEELIWIKPDSPPLGSIKRPRRAWESIHWFGKTGNVYCDVRANGNESDRVGFEGKKGVGDYKNGVKKASKGISRSKDYVEVGTSQVDRSDFNTHPAQYPVKLAEWLIKMLCREGGVVLDPFIGSGTTAVAALRSNRKFIGFELEPEYVEIANKRISDELKTIKGAN